MAPRDSQRQRLYDAEKVLRTHVGSRVWNDQVPNLQTVAQCQAYVDSITSSRWFRARWPRTTIKVKDGRGRSRAGGGYGEVYLPLWARQEPVILHEITHNLISFRASLPTGPSSPG